MKSICSTLKSLMAGILGLILWLSGCNCASANAAAANDSLVNDTLVDLEVKNVHRVYIHHSGNNYNIRLVGRENAQRTHAKLPAWRAKSTRWISVSHLPERH